MKRIIIGFVASVLITGFLINEFAEEIIDFNASMRSFIMTGSGATREFDERGIPLYRNARIGEYRSPFYVVHYGLEYSEACRSEVAAAGSYHWIEDETLPYWHSSPLEASIELFRNSVDWVVQNTEYDDSGNAHLFYHFDWPYPAHPGGILRAQWWSGLTEGHAITLLLRAADCFDDDQYVLLAEEFYRSILTSVEEGGSLLELNGLPWIEEYVDPSAPVDGLSRVFNGMAYAYFGVEAYERFVEQPYMAQQLRESILENYLVFDIGRWSYYDSIGSRANIKYHRINLALLLDQRLQGDSEFSVIPKWSFGASIPIIYYALHGPRGVALWHFYFTLLVLSMSLIAVLEVVFRAVRRVKRE